jgi:carbonic anhydrase/acetyltransferase-like protein (isoleucine patch superfamily)
MISESVAVSATEFYIGGLSPKGENMIRSYQKITPEISEGAFLAETSAVIGKVRIEKGANIWYGAVLRGDEAEIVVGENSNVQDNAVVHTAKDFPARIGKNVTVGHGAIVHGCTIGDDSMIGMGAIVLNGAVIGKGCLIGAGALIKEGQIVPDGSLCVGVPAKVVRQMDEAGIEKIRANARMYVSLGREYQEEC